MRISYYFSFFLAVLFLATSCQRKPSSFNLEQVNNPEAQHIITPGMSSVGIVNNNILYVYYLNENKVWVLDKVSQFEIPEKNHGILALGMGILGILNNDELFFYYMDSSHQWNQNYEMTMLLPPGYKRLSAMRMPWQHGVVAVERPEGMINFYYLDSNEQWQKDETATFILPENIDDYVMLGAMRVGIVSENKLGFYEIGHTGEWEFQNDMVLNLPENADAIISFEPGIISILKDNMLEFYEADTDNRYWILDDTMNFSLPQF